MMSQSSPNKRMDPDLVELVVNCLAFSGCVHKAGHAHRWTGPLARGMRYGSGQLIEN